MKLTCTLVLFGQYQSLLDPLLHLGETLLSPGLLEQSAISLSPWHHVRLRLKPSPRKAMEDEKIRSVGDGERNYVVGEFKTPEQSHCTLRVEPRPAEARRRFRSGSPHSFDVKFLRFGGGPTKSGLERPCILGV